MSGAIVTGGGKGIGIAIAERLLDDGLPVAICGRDQEALAAAQKRLARHGPTIHTFPLDVRDPQQSQEQFARAVEVIGGLRVLVCNAGTGGPNAIDAPSTDGWHRIVQTNLDGTYYSCRAAIPFLPSDGLGRILVLSSVLGKFGVPGYTAYCASKHGLIGFVRALALELAPRRITVNALCPGWVDTDMARQGMEAGAEALGLTFEQFRHQALDQVPLKDMIQPPEVAGLVSYLASPEASRITAQAISICAGSTHF